MAACQCRNSTQYKVVTFCDRRDGTVSENIYFKFIVNVMWEPVPGSTLMKLCPLAQRDAPGRSFNGAIGRSFNRSPGYLFAIKQNLKNLPRRKIIKHLPQFSLSWTGIKRKNLAVCAMAFAGCHSSPDLAMSCLCWCHCIFHLSEHANARHYRTHRHIFFQGVSSRLTRRKDGRWQTFPPQLCSKNNRSRQPVTYLITYLSLTVIRVLAQICDNFLTSFTGS